MVPETFRGANVWASCAVATAAPSYMLIFRDSSPETYGKMRSLAEAYPDLKANQNMLALSEELTSTENKISFARQAYNDAVVAYNTQREVFPANLVASIFHFGPAALFELETVAEKSPPKLSFT